MDEDENPVSLDKADHMYIPTIPRESEGIDGD